MLTIFLTELLFIFHSFHHHILSNWTLAFHMRLFIHSINSAHNFLTSPQNISCSLTFTPSTRVSSSEYRQSIFLQPSIHSEGGWDYSHTKSFHFKLKRIMAIYAGNPLATSKWMNEWEKVNFSLATDTFKQYYYMVSVYVI